MNLTPDHEGVMKTYWESNSEVSVDDNCAPIHNLEYYNLSGWYTVEFYFGDEQTATRINAKLLNARQLEMKFDHLDLQEMPIVGDFEGEFLEDSDCWFSTYGRRFQLEE